LLTWESLMKYCTECGQTLEWKTPAGDNLERLVCTSCAAVHYQNPRIITGCVAQWQGRVLLCRRAIEPRTGSWTVPAGYMENGESMEQAALREAREETGADIRLDALYSVFDIQAINQVYIIYRGVMRSPHIAAGVECSEVRLFEPAEIPWNELFYPAMGEMLERYQSDLVRGRFTLYTGTSVSGRVSSIDKDQVQ
jgi:ADP-ribose pyrophosphatase YjhB (NUDIX family)